VEKLARLGELVTKFGIIFGASVGFATSNSSISSSANSTLPATSNGESQLKVTQKEVGAKTTKFGLSYFTFFNGPNLAGLEEGEWVESTFRGPGRNSVNLANLVSFKYKLTERFSFDAQAKIDYFLATNPQGKDPYLNFDRVRFGVSGELWRGGFWKLTGALNTDLPNVGTVARQRTLILSPGLFSNLTYVRPDSKWSFWALFNPRVWFYEDDLAVEQEWLNRRQRPGEKIEGNLYFSPTINYAVSEKFGFRSGIAVDYRKTVENSWSEWINWATPWQLGITNNIAKSLSIYTFVETFPFSGGGIREDTTAISVWLSGTLL